MLIPLIVIGLAVYSIVDCSRADDRARRGIPFAAWVLFLIVVPVIGPLTWIILSRMGTPPTPQRRTRPVAPDDDPEFLRELERRARRDQPPTAPGAPADDGIAEENTPPSPDEVEDEKPS